MGGYYSGCGGMWGDWGDGCDEGSGDGGWMKVVFDVIRYRVGGGGDWG